MRADVKRVPYFYAIFEDASGVGYGLMQLFKQKELTLIGFHAFPLYDRQTQMNFFPENPKRFQAAMAESGVRLIGPKEAFIVRGATGLNTIIDHHKVLADAGINVKASDGIADPDGRFAYLLWVNHADVERAAGLLGA